MMTIDFCPNCFEKKKRLGKCQVCGYDDTIEHDSDGCLLPGTILDGKYMVGKVLGHGGFGITYLGTDLTIKTKIAIKEYMPSGIAYRGEDKISMQTYKGEKGQQFSLGFTRFIKEAKVLSRFNAVPSIVSVYDVIKANGSAYIIMEYLEGETLSSYVKRNGLLSSKEVKELIMPVLDSLEKVHMANIIHRDIALDNLYMTENGSVKLLDFGAARYAFADKANSLSVVLKPGYAPIEQYSRKGAQGPWTDIYALAATMYAMLTGEAPPDSTDRIAGVEIIYPSQVDPYMKKVLSKALSVSGRDRYQSIEEFRCALTKKKQTSKLIIDSKETSSASNESHIGNPTGEATFLTMSKENDAIETQTNNNFSNVNRKDSKNTFVNKKLISILAGILVVTVMIILVVNSKPIKDTTINDLSTTPIATETISKTTSTKHTSEAQNIPHITETAFKTANPQVVTNPDVVIFTSPLIEKAVRHELCVDDDYVITEDDLLKVTQILICGDRIFDNLNQFDNFGSTYNVDGEFVEGRGDIGSLEDLRQMKNLKLLVLSKQDITEISPLVELPLEALFIDSNMVSDISVLKDLTRLTKVSISDNLIVDLTPIKKLGKLNFLDISDNPITDISCLLGMQIREMWIVDTPIRDYTPLTQLTSLEKLLVMTIPEEGVKAIGTLNNLRNVTIFHGGLKNLEYLKNLSKLQILDIGHNDELSDLSGIGLMPKLQYLSVNNTSVNSLEPLNELPMLMSLSIYDTEISDLEVILDLPSLQYLECDQRQANELRQLSNEISFTINITTFE